MRNGPQILKTAALTAAAAALCAGSVTAAFAQPYPSSDPYNQYDQARQNYNQNADTYQSQQNDYQSKDADYRAQQQAYQSQRDAYEADHARWERARAAYDARWGYGAYERRYGAYRSTTTYYGYNTSPTYRGDTYGSSSTYVAQEPYRGYYSDSKTPCQQQRSSNGTAGTVIGALAGAALGSNLAAHHGGRTGGAVLGAVVGGAIGNNVGRSTAKCDDNGYYYSYDQTYDYDDDGGAVGVHDSRWYRSHRCRLVQAPVDYDGSTEYRWARVCPDSNGYYRFTE